MIQLMEPKIKPNQTDFARLYIKEHIATDV